MGWLVEDYQSQCVKVIGVNFSMLLKAVMHYITLMMIALQSRECKKVILNTHICLIHALVWAVITALVNLTS